MKHPEGPVQLILGATNCMGCRPGVWTDLFPSLLPCRTGIHPGLEGAGFGASGEWKAFLAILMPTEFPITSPKPKPLNLKTSKNHPKNKRLNP